MLAFGLMEGQVQIAFTFGENSALAHLLPLVTYKNSHPNTQFLEGKGPLQS